MYIPLRCVGGTDDSLAFSVYYLAEKSENGDLPFGYWYTGDEAYVCTDSMLTPIPSSRAPLGSPEDAFNFYFSSLRTHIEQAFGVLVSRWRILWRPLRFSIRTNVRIIEGAIKLHNFCIDHGDGCIRKSRDKCDFQHVNEVFELWRHTWHFVLNGNVQQSDAEQNKVRTKLVCEVRELGSQRSGALCVKE